MPARPQTAPSPERQRNGSECVLHAGMCQDEFVDGDQRDKPGYHGHVGVGVCGEDRQSRVRGGGDDLAVQPLGPVEVGPPQLLGERDEGVMRSYAKRSKELLQAC